MTSKNIVHKSKGKRKTVDYERIGRNEICPPCCMKHEGDLWTIRNWKTHEIIGYGKGEENARLIASALSTEEIYNNFWRRKYGS